MDITYWQGEARVVWMQNQAHWIDSVSVPVPPSPCHFLAPLSQHATLTLLLGGCCCDSAPLGEPLLWINIIKTQNQGRKITLTLANKNNSHSPLSPTSPSHTMYTRGCIMISPEILFFCQLNQIDRHRYFMISIILQSCH